MVLKDGGYNRYREQGATNLGELARFVLEDFGMFISFIPFLFLPLIGEYVQDIKDLFGFFSIVMNASSNKLMLTLVTTRWRPQQPPTKSKPQLPKGQGINQGY